MATPQQLRDMVSARPFTPFVVTIGNRVDSRSCIPRTRHAISGAETLSSSTTQGMHHVDMHLVEVLEPAESTIDPAAGSGT